MASKSELAASAVSLGAELGRVVDVEGLSGQALAQLVEELQAAKAALVPPPAPVVEQAAEPTFSVAPGASVCGTRKGTLHELERVGAGDLFGGQEALAALVASGHVVEDKLEP